MPRTCATSLGAEKRLRSRVMTSPDPGYAVTLPLGPTAPPGAMAPVIPGRSPIVIIGPNGSGKTRLSRQLSGGPSTPQFINALRNTAVEADVGLATYENARNQLNQQLQQSRSTHYALANEFNQLLQQLVAEDQAAAMSFMQRWRSDSNNAGEPAETTWLRLQRLWTAIFTGRTIEWRGTQPWVISETTGVQAEYSANNMSDGEKAALYIIGRVLLAESGVLVVDEAETHLHPLLANRLWDALEDARPDVRFVYLTHDLSLALTRREATYVLASPVDGLSVIQVDDRLPDTVAEALLGAATLSFRARRIVFAEGKGSSIDAQLYTAWFDSADTVVRSVDGCDMVMQSTSAVTRAGFTSNLQSLGIIDGDYRSDALKNALPRGVVALPLHEVESLFAVEGIVAAVCAHVRQPFDRTAYAEALCAAVTEGERHAIVVRRWQARMEPQLQTLLNKVNVAEPLDTLIGRLPELFDHTSWTFDPKMILEEEKVLVETAIPGTDIFRILTLAPGKYMLPVALRVARLDKTTYKSLVIDALRQPDDPTFTALAPAVVAALSALLPARKAQPLKAMPSPPVA